jgi:hypothetical protein
VRDVPQLSLFSADARPAGVQDLAGLLCGPGQIVRFGAGDQARLSIVLADASRARAVTAACAATGIGVEPVTTDTGATALRTAFRCDLVDLAREWTAGAVKAVPPGWQLDGAALRLWALAAGRPDERGGYLLTLDPSAPDTHVALIAAATRAGLPPARVARGTSADDVADGRGPRWAGPALRISGTRRVRRLVELVGPAPTGIPEAQWPRYWGRHAC